MIVWNDPGLTPTVARRNAAGPAKALAAQAPYEEATFGERVDYCPAARTGTATFSEPPLDWLADFRALVALYEKERWQGLVDGSESREFVPVRMRLVKHFFDAYDMAHRTRNEALAAVMKSKLRRRALDPIARWGALL